MAHSQEFIDQVIKTVFENPELSNRQIAKTFNISHNAVNLWVSQSEEMPVSYKNRPNKDIKWTPKQKFEAVLKFEKITEEEQGAYLRENGIYLAQIERWKEEMLGGLEHPKDLTEKENKLLKKELQEKRALVELQKKVQNLLDDED